MGIADLPVLVGYVCQKEKPASTDVTSRAGFKFAIRRLIGLFRPVTSIYECCDTSDGGLSRSVATLQNPDGAPIPLSGADFEWTEFRHTNLGGGNWLHIKPLGHPLAEVWTATGPQRVVFPLFCDRQKFFFRFLDVDSIRTFEDSEHHRFAFTVREDVDHGRLSCRRSHLLQTGIDWFEQYFQSVHRSILFSGWWHMKLGAGSIEQFDPVKSSIPKNAPRWTQG